MSKELESRPNITAHHNFFAYNGVESFSLQISQLTKSIMHLPSTVDLYPSSSIVQRKTKEIQLKFREIYVWFYYQLKVNPKYQEMVQGCQRCQLRQTDFVPVAKSVSSRCSGFAGVKVDFQTHLFPPSATLLTRDNMNDSVAISKPNCGIDPVDLHRGVRNLYDGQV